jgi:RNAse (barnase) inhibitor barstar
VYRVAGAVPVGPAGWRVGVLDGATITDAAGLLYGCAVALDFPGWYGRNWDALADCLRDLSWLPAGGYLLVWRAADRLRGADPTAFGTACRIFARVSGERQRMGLPPLLVLLGEGGSAGGLEGTGLPAL